MIGADQQQRADAAELLRVALEERSLFIKAYERLQNNVTVFVDRSNHELLNLARLIMQKEQNIESLQRMAQGQMLNPQERPVTAEGAAPAPPPAQQQPAQQPHPPAPPLPAAPPDHADVRARLDRARSPHQPNGQQHPATPAAPEPPAQDASPK